MADINGPARINQRALYFSETEAVVTAIKAEVAKEQGSQTWASIVGSEASDLVQASNLVGKVVEGPTGLGTSVSTTPEPVLGQTEADSFPDQPTRLDLTFGVQARHSNALFKSLRDKVLNSEAVIAYSERESDTAWTVAIMVVNSIGSEYVGDVGTIASRMRFTFSRSTEIRYVGQAS